MHIVAEVAARRGKVLTRKTATKSNAGTAKMAPTEAAAQMSAAAEPAHVSAAAEPTAHLSATETTTVSTPTTASPAARKRVSGQSPGKSGSRSQKDHGLA
jgi:hypothetical protein